MQSKKSFAFNAREGSVLLYMIQNPRIIQIYTTTVPPNKRIYTDMHLYTHRNYTAKVKFTPEQATKAQRGSRGIVVLFLYPRRWMGVGGHLGWSGRERKISPPS